MIPKALRDERDRVEKAVDQLGESIFARMDVIARRMNLDEMVFTMYGNSYRRDNKTWESKQLDELDQLYCDNVHSAGFQGRWTKEKGWV